MKKIFTLLICLMGMTLAANATDITPIENCINYLLANHSNNEVIRATNLNAEMDANHDGVIDIQDVTFMIKEMIKAQQQANCAPARDIDINGLIHEVLKTETETPNIDDVTDAINEKLREK